MRNIKIEDFNIKECKKMTKKQFLKQHEYFKNQIDLEDAYDKIKASK